VIDGSSQNHAGRDAISKIDVGVAFGQATTVVLKGNGNIAIGTACRGSNAFLVRVDGG
jgi:hypothetical protein